MLYDPTTRFYTLISKQPLSSSSANVWAFSSKINIKTGAECRLYPQVQIIPVQKPLVLLREGLH